MSSLKIIVATHKAYWMPDHGIYLPLQVGAEGKPSIGLARDDIGENISGKNANWCELTGLYWAWKNLDADAVGLVHYRRHFKGLKGVATESELQALLLQYGVILPKARNYYIETNYSQYVHAHHAEDLIVTRNVLVEHYPMYVDAFDRVMKSTKGHRFNMMVMRKEVFDSYCKWLFGVLGDVECRLDITGYSAYDARVFGFISERLLDVWLLANGIKYVEMPILHLEKQHWISKICRFLIRKFKGD